MWRQLGVRFHQLAKQTSPNHFYQKGLSPSQKKKEKKKTKNKTNGLSKGESETVIN